MELLPVELILSICDRLPQRDSCRLCSTCRRLLGILPRVVAGWRIEELVVKEPRLVHPDFVRRNLPALSRIVVIIDCFDRRFLPYVDYLGSLFDACDRVETLTIKSTLRFFDNSRNSKVVPILNKLLGLISKLSVKEIRVEPGLRKLILPPSVEKCRMDASCLANLNQPMDIPRRPADAGKFDKITSMSLYIRQRSGGGNIFKCGNLWENLSLFPALVDLSLRGSGPPRDMSENNNCPIPAGVRRLSLNVPLNTTELGFLSPLSNLEALSLGRLRIGRYEDGGPHPPMMWPPLLKELRVAGEAITDDCLLYRWLMDTGCDASPTLERIFVHFDATNWLATRFQTPALPSSDYGRFRGDVLRNLSLLVNDVPTWRLAYELLRSLETLDELWLLFAMEDGGQLIDRIKVDVAMYGTVSTRISRLRIADGNLFRDGSVFRSHPFHEWSFFILACFPDVDVYQLHTSAPVIADSSAASMAVERWNRNRMASSTLMLHVKWYKNPPYEKLKLVGVPLTILRVTLPGSCCDVNLTSLRQVARNLEELEIESGNFDGSGSCLDMYSLPSLLHFAKLRKISLHVNQLEVKALREGLRNLEPLLGQPPSRLEEVNISWAIPPTILTLFVTPFGVKEYRRERELAAISL